jgi:hypothetical protein
MTVGACINVAADPDPHPNPSPGGRGALEVSLLPSGEGGAKRRMRVWVRDDVKTFCVRSEDQWVQAHPTDRITGATPRQDPVRA